MPALSVVVCCVSRSGPRVTMTVAPASAWDESSTTRPRNDVRCGLLRSREGREHDEQRDGARSGASEAG